MKIWKNCLWWRFWRTITSRAIKNYILRSICQRIGQIRQTIIPASKWEGARETHPGSTRWHPWRKSRRTTKTIGVVLIQKIKILQIKKQRLRILFRRPQATKFWRREQFLATEGILKAKANMRINIRIMEKEIFNKRMKIKSSTMSLS